MSDSVGKISLDLEIKSDLAGQISSISNLIGKNLKTSLESTTKSTFSNMNKNIKGSLGNMNSSMKNTFNRMQANLKKLFESFKNIKMPRIDFQKPSNQVDNSKSIAKNIQTRGPPDNKEMLGAKIQNVTATLDTVNARIEQQQEKLAQLRESYSRTFNQNRKNKLEGQMLKTEATINKLIDQSDKLGFELSELDAKYAALGASAGKAAGGNNKFSNSIKNVDKNTRRAGNSFRSSHNGLSMFMGTMIKWGIIFPIVQRGIMVMATSLGQSLMTNQQFANSLAQIKTNLSVAFTPIFNAILPALNALMSALATATTYIASFISAIFGKTYQQSYNATQSLIDAKAAMGAYGDTTEKAGKQAKKAQGSLAGFDEINTLNMDNGADDAGTSGGGSGGADIPTLTPPSIDTSSVDSSMKRLVDKIKEFISTIDFAPLKKSFENLKVSIVPIVENIGRILSWFMTNILGPLTKWTIENLLPAFFNLLAGVFKVLNPLLEVFMSLGQWLWESFLQPIATWTGGIIVGVLNGLADILTRIGQWISEKKPLIENLILVIGSFALAWGIVTLALKTWTLVCGIATMVTGGLGSVIGFLTSPIGIAILAIGAIIAIGVLLYKNWDWIKEKCGEVWTWIQYKLKQFSDWLTMIFTTDWSKSFGVLGEVLNVFLKFIKDIWDSVKKILSGVIDFIVGVFTGNWSKAWDGIKQIFSGVWDIITGILKAFGNFLNYIFTADWSKGFGALGHILNGFFASVSQIWNGIKQVFTGIINFISGVFTGNWSKAWDGIKQIFKGIWDTFVGIAKSPINMIVGLINGMISAINVAIRGINKLKWDVPDWVPVIGGQHWGFNISEIGSVPYLAKGGIIDSPTLAMVGEAGREAVVPLENNTGWKDEIGSMVANAVLSAMQFSGGSSKSSSNTGDIILQIDGTTFARIINPYAAKENQRLGNSMIIKTV